MRHSTFSRQKLALVLATLALLSPLPQLFADTPFTIPPGRATDPFNMTVGADHNLWFTETGGLKIGRITPAGVITEFSITGAQSLLGIVSGPDGNIWFTDQFAGFIGRINTSGGGLVTFKLAPNSHPQGITVGPDGNLWFVDQADTGAVGTGFAIGKITTMGQVTEYPTKIDSGIFDAEDFTPASIAAGPDGNLWFVNPQVSGHFGKNLIDKISTTGVVHQPPYPLGDTPQGITAGPDGNLWVIESKNVSKVTTSGVETPYSLGTGTGYAGITTGPDGNIWFTRPRGLGYVTPGGMVTNFPPSDFPGFLYLSGITSGPDHALWFLGFQSSNIGRFTTNGQLTNTYPLNSGSNPTWSTLGPDGAVWFSQSGPARIGGIDVNGVYSSCALAQGSNPHGIVTGPDHNLWFLEAGTYKVATMTTHCAITEYPVGDGQTDPGLWEITNGSDGNLWFTEYQPTYNNIVRITTDGVMTPFPIPTPGAQALYPTSGPDGNVWFTETAGQKVAYIDLHTLQITEYLYPGIGKPPEAIVAGPDGNFWIMIGTAFGAIAKFSPSGTLLAEYPAQFQTLNDIRVGSDGAVWFDQFYPNGVGRITTSGTLSYVSLTEPNAQGGTPTIGADRKFWVSENAAGAVGRMSAIGGTGNTITANHGSPFKGAVASFVDGTPVAQQTDFTAQVDWGDGTRSAGTVSGNMGGPFTVRGTHTYVAAGTYNLTVTLHDNVDNATYTASRGVAHVH
jgi:streptogramin lyase